MSLARNKLLVHSAFLTQWLTSRRDGAGRRLAEHHGWPQQEHPEAAVALARGLRSLGVQHGGAGRPHPPHPLGPLYDRLEAFGREAAPQPGALLLPSLPPCSRPAHAHLLISLASQQTLLSAR